MSKDIQLSEIELHKIGLLQQKKAEAEAVARRQVANIEGQLSDTFDLIGDRYGVDLKSGKYRLEQGRIVEVGGDEDPKDTRKLLKED